MGYRRSPLGWRACPALLVLLVVAGDAACLGGDSRPRVDDAGAQSPIPDGASDATDAAGLDAAPIGDAHDAPCAAATSQATCVACCAMAHAAGDGIYATMLDNCACGNAGPCTNACGGNYCNDPATASADCTSCLQTTCVPRVHASCAQPGSPCGAYVACLDAEGCAGKP